MASTVHIDLSMRDQLSAVARRAMASLKNVKKVVDKNSDALKKYNKRQAETKKGMKGLGAAASKMKGLLAVGAVLAVGSKALDAAATAETAALKVLSNVKTRAEKIRLAPMIKEALEEAGRMGIPMNEAGDALFTMTSQLGASAETFKKFKGAQGLAVGGFADLQASVSVVNKMMEQFNDLDNDSQKTASMIFQAQVIGDTSVQQLAQALPSVMGSAKVAGLKASETLSIVAASSKRTKNTQASAEALKALIASFQNVTKGSDRAAAFKSLGIAPGTKALNDQGLINIMEKIVEKRSTQGGQALIDRAFTGEGAKMFLNNLDAGMIAAIKTGTVEIEGGTALALSLDDVSKSMAVNSRRITAQTDSALAAAGGGLMARGQAGIADAMLLSAQEAQAGNNYLFNLLGNSLSALASTLTNTGNAAAYRAERRDQLGIGVTVDNRTDNPISVTTESTKNLDTGVQSRGS
jgi:TP901 family phage tail tape measure protein